MTTAVETDTGLFGPHSLTWRVHLEPVLYVGGLRALILQALHPWVMIGTYQNSALFDPAKAWARFVRTAEFVGVRTYGTTAEVEAAAGREVEIGGLDVVSYGEMLDLMARALGLRPRPKLRVPLLTPGLSSLWIGLVTPVDAGVARPLVEGLRTPTVVEDPSGAALFGVEPQPLEEMLRRAIAEDNAQRAAA